MVEYEAEVKQLYREVAELKHAVYKKVQVKKSGPSVSSVQNHPAESESVPEASSEPTVAGFPVHHNPFKILDHEIHLAGMDMESDSDDEEVIPLLDPRRNRPESSVSSVGQNRKPVLEIYLQNQKSVFNQPMGTEIRNVQAPQ